MDKEGFKSYDRIEVIFEDGVYKGKREKVISYLEDDGEWSEELGVALEVEDENYNVVAVALVDAEKELNEKFEALFTDAVEEE